MPYHGLNLSFKFKYKFKLQVKFNWYTELTTEAPDSAAVAPAPAGLGPELLPVTCRVKSLRLTGRPRPATRPGAGGRGLGRSHGGPGCCHLSVTRTPRHHVVTGDAG